METRIRIRVGNVELEVAGEEEFVTNRLPILVSDLMSRLTFNNASETPPVDGVPSSDTKLVSIAGDVRDFWTNAVISGASVSAIGISPNSMVQSDEAGRFLVSGQSRNQQCYLLVSKGAEYVETSNLVEISSGTAILSAVAIAKSDISRQYTSVGLTYTPAMTILIVNILDSNGGALDMLSTIDITLKNATGNPVGNGPFFFGASGDIQDQATTPISQALANRARAAFLNVPHGQHSLHITVTRAEDMREQGTFVIPDAGEAIVIRARLPQ